MKICLTFFRFYPIMKNMKPYEHNKIFSVKFCDTDFKDELKPSAMLAYLEEVACSSAEELGFGYSYVKPLGYAFMLTNIRCRFERAVPLGMDMRVCTWPTIPSYVVFGREYKIFDPEGNALVNATSKWCLVDLKEGKILQSKLLTNQDYSTYNTARALEEDKRKIPVFDIAEGELGFSLQIANSEYDHNMHVNNTRYADYIFNCFSVSYLKVRKLKEFALSYLKQCHEGQVLSFYKKETGENTFLVQGMNEAGEAVIRAEIFFEA